MGLREAANVSAYAEQAVEQAAPLAEKWASMSDRERDELAAEGERRLCSAAAMDGAWTCPEAGRPMGQLTQAMGEF